jgi:hypothetical protein
VHVKGALVVGCEAQTPTQSVVAIAKVGWIAGDGLMRHPYLPPSIQHEAALGRRGVLGELTSKLKIQISHLAFEN